MREKPPEIAENPNQWAFSADKYSKVNFDFFDRILKNTVFLYYKILFSLSYFKQTHLEFWAFFLLVFFFERERLELRRSVTFRPFQSTAIRPFPLATFSHFSKPPVFYILFYSPCFFFSFFFFNQFYLFLLLLCKMYVALFSVWYFSVHMIQNFPSWIVITNPTSFINF